VIPRAVVEVRIAVDRGRVRCVDAETVATGLACVHEYDDGIYSAASWEGAEGTLTAEAEALARLNASTDDEDEFDDAAFGEQEELWLALELGVTGASEALCAAGCPTFASCRGHSRDFGGRSRHPWLLFAADERRVPLLEAAAGDVGCGLELDESGLVQAWAPSLVEIVAFGCALHARRREFADLPEPFPRFDAAARDEWDP
jgi:hypothetical protein